MPVTVTENFKLPVTRKVTDSVTVTGHHGMIMASSLSATVPMASFKLARRGGLVAGPDGTVAALPGICLSCRGLI